MKILLASNSPRRYELLGSHGFEPVVFPPSVDESSLQGIDETNPEAVVTYLSLAKARDVAARLMDPNPDGASKAPDIVDDTVIASVIANEKSVDAYVAPPGASGRFADPGVAPSIAGNDLVVDFGVAPIITGSDLSTNACVAMSCASPWLLLAADTIVFCDRIIGKPLDEQEAFDILSSYRLRTHEVWTGVTLIDRVSGDTDTFAVCTKVTVGDYTDEEIWRYIREEKPFDKAGAYAIQSDWKRHIMSVDGDYENVIGLPWFPLKEHIDQMVENVKNRELFGDRSGA